MDELKRRFLEQQIEIGGAEVVLERPVAPRQASESPQVLSAAQTPAPKPAGATAKATTQPPVRPEPPKAVDAARAAAKDWRIGAPPIPEPGLTILAPVVDLLKEVPTWANLEAVAADIGRCQKCFLCQGRTNVVPGEGNPQARLVLIGEGPGQTEDETGRPFVGRAGELLTGILAAIGYARDEVFILNVVKCRPPQNRKPLPDEMASCFPYLAAQLDLIKPKVLLALGATAAEALLQSKQSLTNLRGKVHSYRGIPLVVTYHPAALLRNPNWKKPTWDDVRIARQLVDR